MRIIILLAAATLSFVAASPAAAQAQPDKSSDSIHYPVYGKTGMVASQDVLGSRVAAQVLADGGNAVDAAIATAFTLAVTMQRAGNIGGGGFMLVYDAESGETTAIDYRENAPLGATRDMFLDANGDADPMLSRFSHKAAGVPGTVAGMHLAHRKFGSLPWERLLAPAIKLAKHGFVVSKDLADAISENRQRLCRFEASCEYFSRANGDPLEFGDRLVQADLARTLQLISDEGPDAFYKGEIADQIVAEMQAGGGLIDKASLAAYEPVIRKPLRGSYRGYDIVTMPPPSSGGVHIVQMLNILEHFPIADMGWGSADKIHVLAEVMRLAYADRSKHLGDPDYYDVPVDWLVSAEYAAELADTIDMQRARPSSEVGPGVAPPQESMETTHFSIMDNKGNVVSNTYTLNLGFGSGISVRGAGFLLNNEMDDFVSKPGVPNAFGLLGDEANAVEAGKRPLSSMSPVIVFDEGVPWLATGSPGGSRIITAVLQTIINVVDHEMNIAEAISRARMHHQWYPDLLLMEAGYSLDTVRILEQRGHNIRLTNRTWSSVQNVAFRNGLFRGASDPRLPDGASVAPETMNAN
jgi:gamma-glutamyltranspeptidase/glutathione hydrolase